MVKSPQSMKVSQPVLLHLAVFPAQNTRIRTALFLFCHRWVTLLSMLSFLFVPPFWFLLLLLAPLIFRLFLNG